MAITSKEINLLQLDQELDNHGLIADFNDPTAKIIEVADGSPITAKELDDAIKAHKAVFITPSIADKLAGIGLSIDDLKAALGV